MREYIFSYFKGSPSQAMVLIIVTVCCGAQAQAPAVQTRSSGALAGRAFVCDDTGVLFRADGGYIRHDPATHKTFLAKWALKEGSASMAVVTFQDVQLIEGQRVTKTGLATSRWTFTDDSWADVSFLNEGRWKPLGRCGEIGPNSIEMLSKKFDDLTKATNASWERQRSQDDDDNHREYGPAVQELAAKKREAFSLLSRFKAEPGCDRFANSYAKLLGDNEQSEERAVRNGTIKSASMVRHLANLYSVFAANAKAVGCVR